MGYQGDARTRRGVQLAEDGREVIFAVNLMVGALLAVAIRVLARRGGFDQEPGPVSAAPSSARASRLVGWLLAFVAVSSFVLVCVRPGPIMRDLTWGAIFVPYVGEGRWLTPIGLVCLGALLGFLLHSTFAGRPLVDLRSWGRAAREADLLGAILLALALSGVILAFASADPKVQVFSSNGLLYLAGAAIAAVLFGAHLRRAPHPLVPRGTFAARPAWGSLAVSFFIGSALIAALIDIPIFARTTIYSDSQLLAALVLVRFLIALPVGALAGGALLRRVGPGPLTALGMGLAAVAFYWFSTWGLDSLGGLLANVPLLIGGFGFGLALAPVNAAVLDSTADQAHGLATATVVVARMVGMLVGISALTTIGLRRYYAEQRDIPPIRQVCDGRSRCDAFTLLLKEAGIAQEQAVFLGAALCAVIAAALALALFGSGRGSGPPGVTVDG